MQRTDWDYLTIGSLAICGLYATLSGLVADIFGLHDVFLHAAAGYASAVLAGLHIVLQQRRIRSYVRRRLFRAEPGERPSSQTQQSTTTRRTATSPRGRRLVLAGLLSGAGGFLLGWLLPSPSPTKPGEKDLGLTYHRWSKAGSARALQDWGPRPEPVKTYTNMARHALPAPWQVDTTSLRAAMERRRSVRSYGAGALTQEELATLLHAASGITDQERAFRAAPSAGALYPIETYAFVQGVVGLAPGIYHYALHTHALELIRAGDFSHELTRAGLLQSFLGKAPVCLALSAVFQRTRWRYHQRTYRYVMLEAGHIGQNVYLAATGLGLGACAVGAFLDGTLNELLRIDGEQEAALYLLSVGRR